ncbi:hypothetical protein E3983_02545 [Legionella israelensis]|uniref:Uncharacterized protein n=1 Tax=Legionella israelensis TaxID=454 RepID=A0A0W0V748_9GAMM|nr:hypothetical protein [Legionella israelensis]KTD15925.1 hypothetical protein Lisr_2237 [Legionella israelensis]QBR83339.1 hypothetical protein E3983_02545 [Legionella israelensis]QBS09286.1 hypothetical protein E4T55_05110 [Legionella israelensis]SCY21735.1 hypothetical protein SAMN02746069_01670 [Legionella israelensis DSM 19235]STX59040.1 Uncharacterised protein [Legionella israelensis]
MTKDISYADQLFESLSDTIENIGKEDPDYDDKQKALDILNVLESLLAYTIYTTCITSENVRDSAEESYMNIKRQALEMIRRNPPEDI